MMTELPLEISCREARELLDAGADAVLLDCRERDEHAMVAIRGAELIPMSELQDRVGELLPRRDHRIVVHCHHGGRSARVAAWLRQQGFALAQSMAGGIDQWAVEIEPGMVRY
jgi:rhodanese-related sulfurtransferase